MTAVFHALAHDARRDMLERLSIGELTVGELAAPLEMSLAAASKHVQVLERAGLVCHRVAGTRHFCRLSPAPLASAAAWLNHYEHFWNERLDSLADLFSEPRPPVLIERKPMPSISDSERTAVHMERVIPAPPDEVYRAWLDPQLLRRWMAPGPFEVIRAEVDERVGGRFAIWHGEGGTDAGGFECELLELVPDRRIVFRWGFVGPLRGDGPRFDSVLTVTLAEAVGGKTVLTLVHERLDDLANALPDVAGNVGPGWDLVLDKLSSLLSA